MEVENWVLGLILVSALLLILIMRWQKHRNGGFNPPPTPRRRGEESIFDGLEDPDDLAEGEGESFQDWLRRSKGEGGDGLSEEGSQEPRRPRRVVVRPKDASGRPTADRRPADDDDMLMNSLLLGTLTGVPVPHDQAKAIVSEALRAEDARSKRDDATPAPAPHRDRPGEEEPSTGFGGGSSNFSRDADDSSQGFGSGRSEGGGASGNYTSPDTGGSPSGD